MADEVKFTPGPWVAVPATTRWHFQKPVFPDGLWHILPESNVERLPICEVDHADDHDEVTRKRAEGDARLIAAAPELLAACTLALARSCMCESSTETDWHSDHCAVPALRAAIASAAAK